MHSLPGGDKAVKEPIRVAVSLLTTLYGEHLEGVNLPALDALSVQQLSVYAKMAARHFNSPKPVAWAGYLTAYQR